MSALNFSPVYYIFPCAVQHTVATTTTCLQLPSQSQAQTGVPISDQIEQMDEEEGSCTPASNVSKTTSLDGRRRRADTGWYKAFGNRAELVYLFKGKERHKKRDNHVEHAGEIESDHPALRGYDEDVQHIDSHESYPNHDNNSVEEEGHAESSQPPRSTGAFGALPDSVLNADGDHFQYVLDDDTAATGEVNGDIPHVHPTYDDEMPIVHDFEEAPPSDEIDSSSELTTTSTAAQTVLKNSKYMLSWSSMMSILTTCGHVRFTAAAYNVLASAIKTVNGTETLLTYKTVHERLRRLLLDVSYPKSDIVNFSEYSPEELIKGNYMPIGFETTGTGSTLDAVAEKSARLVLPSAWACQDVMTYPFYKNMFDSEAVMSEKGLGMETASVVRDRNKSNTCGFSLWAMHVDDTGLTSASLGDRIKFACDSEPNDFDNRSINSLGWKNGCVEHEDGRGNEAFVYGLVGPMWCVRAAEDSRPLNIAWVEALDDNEKIVVKLAGSAAPLRDLPRRKGNKRAKRGPNSSLNERKLALRPGDVCVIIRADLRASSNVVCLFVASFWRKDECTPSERLVWIPIAALTDGESLCSGDGGLQVRSDCTVTAIPALIKRNAEDARQQSRSCSGPCIGTLKDGSPYVVYRMILYADGFNASSQLFAPKSFHGIYMLPVGLEQSWRTTPASIRVISLAPPGVQKNKVLQAVIPDIVRGTVHGFEAMDPFGRKVRVFLDVVGFEGDYPEAAAVMDTLGHVGNAPCTLCSFRKKKNGDGTKHAYTSQVHNKRLAFARFSDRIDQLRMAGISNEEARLLGFKSGNIDVTRLYPMVALAQELAKVHNHVPKNTDGVPVVSAIFDTYSNNFVAPDHLLTGIAHDLLTVCFESLDSDEVRQGVSAEICASLAENGLPTQLSLINKDTKIHGMSMTATFCVLMTSSVIFSRLFRNKQRTCVTLIRMFQNIVAEVYWWPSLNVDGRAAVAYATDRDGTKYYSALHRLVSEFNNTLESLSRSQPQQAAKLDKPNIHRLVELVVHTIPLCKHGRNISEMPFELFHQGLKNVLKSNTHRTAHITAVEHSMANDWQGRLRMLYHFATNGDEEARAASTLGLKCLLLGKQSVQIRGVTPEIEELMASFEYKVTSMFREPVKSLLAQGGRVNNSWGGGGKKWEGFHLDRDEKYKDAHVFGMDVLKRVYGAASWKASVLKAYASVRLLNWKAITEDKRAYAYNTIRPGQAFSALVEQPTARDAIVNCAEAGEGNTVHYAAMAFIGYDPLDVWAVVRIMEEEDGLFTVSSDSYSLLHMGEQVRRVALFHECDDNCKWSGGKLIHGADVAGGGSYSVVGRREGYPPHMG